jgi:hypothetical protein
VEAEDFAAVADIAPVAVGIGIALVVADNNIAPAEAGIAHFEQKLQMKNKL